MGLTIGINLDSLRQLAAQAGEAADDAARPAAQAAAQVLYDETLKNVAQIRSQTGNLRRSIYQAYSQRDSVPGRAVYNVSWNPRKAPHAMLVEFGHLQRYEVSFDPVTKRFTTHKDRPLPTPKLVAAKPFLRPAMARFPAAMEAAKAVILHKMERL